MTYDRATENQSCAHVQEEAQRLVEKFITQDRSEFAIVRGLGLALAYAIFRCTEKSRYRVVLDLMHLTVETHVAVLDDEKNEPRC